MQKVPTYLGIFAIDPKGSAKDLRVYARECVEEVVNRVNSIRVQQDYASFDQLFNYPKDTHHITTLYIGGNPKHLKAKQNQQLNQFKYDIKVPIKIQLCFYVPDTIIVGYSPDTCEIPCQNHCPHVTILLTGNTKPVQSNSVCELVLTQCPNIAKQDFEVKQINTKYNDKSIFVIKKQIAFNAVTSDNFKMGHRK